MSEADDDSEFRVPYPLELIIEQTPVSAQTTNGTAKEVWKKTVGRCAQDRINALRDQYFLDERALMATIYYFPPVPMMGDVDNIVKPILDGMIAVAYPDDKYIEKVVVQKFEPDVSWLFSSPSPTLDTAINMDKPILYIRLEDDLVWRQVP